MILNFQSIIVCSGIILVSVLIRSDAHQHGSYMRNADDGFNYRTNWMSNIQNHVRLSELAIPGTHDSSTFKGYGGDSATTQVLSFDQQLNYGIRFFDIRVRHYANAFALHHAFVYLHVNFDDFLDSVSNFLRSNPSETVLFRLKEEYDSEGNSRSIAETLQWYLYKHQGTYLKTNNRDINLGSARGKFIILSDNYQFDSFGLQYGQSNIQDNYNLGTNWDLYSKWESVKNQLENAKNGDPNTFYINYLSGSGGSFPYFVASGHSSPGTSAPRLATGMTTPGWSSSSPDFPRIDCFIGICTIAFEGTNTLTYDKIREYNENRGGSRRTVGIIVADFPGDSLIDVIIRNN
ncbi:hypothetical protein J6590_003016 [Homalodisca vitripennis]|nr:hypothetical protein J6590_003016 [Homalodisca vitripennis]